MFRSTVFELSFNTLSVSLTNIPWRQRSTHCDQRWAVGWHGLEHWANSKCKSKSAPCLFFSLSFLPYKRDGMLDERQILEDWHDRLHKWRAFIRLGRVIGLDAVGSKIGEHKSNQFNKFIIVIIQSMQFARLAIVTPQESSQSCQRLVQCLLQKVECTRSFHQGHVGKLVFDILFISVNHSFGGVW